MYSNFDFGFENKPSGNPEQEAGHGFAKQKMPFRKQTKLQKFS
jgi:hypothetical protein